MDRLRVFVMLKGIDRQEEVFLQGSIGFYRAFWGVKGRGPPTAGSSSNRLPVTCPCPARLLLRSKLQLEGFGSVRFLLRVLGSGCLAHGLKVKGSGLCVFGLSKIPGNRCLSKYPCCSLGFPSVSKL